MPTETIRVGGKKLKTLKWLLRPGLKTVFVGVNPAPVSVKAGHYYQGKQGRRFWSRIQDFSITGSLPEGKEDQAAFAQDFGFADIVRRPTASAKNLTKYELEVGAARLVRRLKGLPDRPLIAFVYSKAAEKAESALRAEGFETFRLPGPYEKKQVVASRMKTLKAKLRKGSIKASSARQQRAVLSHVTEVTPSGQASLGGKASTPPFKMNKARWFLEEMVKGAHADWRRDALSNRHARCAVGFVNDMAEWAYHHLGLDSKFPSASAFRTHMAEGHREFRIVADVANGTKHVVLTKGERVVTNAEQTRPHQHGSIDSVVDFDSIEDFDSLSEWIVELDDGSWESLGPLLQVCIQMWEDFLTEKGV